MDYNNIFSEELKELTFEEASRELKLTPKKDDLLFFNI